MIADDDIECQDLEHWYIVKIEAGCSDWVMKETYNFS